MLRISCVNLKIDIKNVKVAAKGNKHKNLHHKTSSTVQSLCRNLNHRNKFSFYLRLYCIILQTKICVWKNNLFSREFWIRSKEKQLSKIKTLKLHSNLQELPIQKPTIEGSLELTKVLREQFDTKFLKVLLATTSRYKY